MGKTKLLGYNMRSDVIKEMLENIPQETKDREARQMEEPFSPFGSILPEEWWYWDQNNWPVDEYINHAASEAWNLDESSDRGYIAMKRMLSDLVNPKKEELSYEEFTKRLKELYDERRKDC